MKWLKTALGYSGCLTFISSVCCLWTSSCCTAGEIHREGKKRDWVVFFLHLLRKQTFSCFGTQVEVTWERGRTWHCASWGNKVLFRKSKHVARFYNVTLSSKTFASRGSRIKEEVCYGVALKRVALLIRYLQLNSTFLSFVTLNQTQSHHTVYLKISESDWIMIEGESPCSVMIYSECKSVSLLSDFCIILDDCHTSVFPNKPS